MRQGRSQDGKPRRDCSRPVLGMYWIDTGRLGPFLEAPNNHIWEHGWHPSKGLIPAKIAHLLFVFLRMSDRRKDSR